MQWASRNVRAQPQKGKGKRWRLSKGHYALICIAAISTSVGLLVLVRAGATSVKVNISIAKIAFKTTADARLSSINISPPYTVKKIDNIRSLEAPLMLVPGQPYSIVADQRALKVPSLPIGAGTWVSIESYPNAGFSVNLKAKTDKFRVSAVQTGPNVYLLNRANAREQLPLGPDGIETLSIGLDNATAPLAFVFQQLEKYDTCSVETRPDFFFPNVRSLPLESVSFGAEENPTLSIFISAVLGGTVKLEDVGRTITLSPADVLRVKFRLAKMSQLTILPCYISIGVDAIADEIWSGSEGRLTDLRPTYLELAFKQPSLSFVISCLVTLWGFLWGLKELFLPAKKD